MSSVLNPFDWEMSGMLTLNRQVAAVHHPTWAVPGHGPCKWSMKLQSPHSAMKRRRHSSVRPSRWVRTSTLATSATALPARPNRPATLSTASGVSRRCPHRRGAPALIPLRAKNICHRAYSVTMAARHSEMLAASNIAAPVVAWVCRNWPVWRARTQGIPARQVGASSGIRNGGGADAPSSGFFPRSNHAWRAKSLRP